MSESNQIPDSISSDKLKQLLGKIAPEMPLSQVIPELSFRDEKSDSGGLCDLQFVICQLVEKSKSGLEYHQILTASLYLFERCVFFLGESIKEAETTYEQEDRHGVISELHKFRDAFDLVFAQLQELHMSMSTAATMDRIQSLRKVLGDFTDQKTYRSHLLLSQDLLDSLKLDREEVTEFVEKNDL